MHHITRFRVILLVLAALLTFGGVLAQETTPEPVPDDPLRALQPAFSVEDASGVQLDVYFSNLQQGRAGLLGVQGADISNAQAAIFNRRVDFFQIEGESGWWALIAASMTRSPRQYDLTVTVEREGQAESATLFTRINVNNGGFIRQEVTLVPDERLEILLDPEVEAAELAHIFERAGIVTETPLWDERGFIAPLSTELTSPFGAVRVFNGELNTVHTGWDFQAQTGMPVIASGRGVVSMAEHLPIRGNYVMVDHGRGVYSGYAHLSVMYVTQGQPVEAGQLIGLVGSTGRSSSAHAHAEFIVDNEWVDAADFILMDLPGT